MARLKIAFDAAPSQIGVMPYHRFKVGQSVVALSGGAEALIPRGPQVIVRLLPLVGRDPQYRVHSTVDGHDRVVLEGQIMLIEERPAPVAQKVAAKKSTLVTTRRRR